MYKQNNLTVQTETSAIIF